MPHSSTPPAAPRPTTRLRAWLRVACLLGFVALLSAVWVLRDVHAQASERALSLGRNLSQAHDIHAGSTRLQLNGAVLTLNSSSSAGSVDAVLDRFTALCLSSSAGLEKHMAELEQQGEAMPSDLSFKQLSVFRTPTEHDQGSAACFARNRKVDSLTDFLADAETALETGDLAQLGQFRYVFARKSPQTGTSHVISVWSEGALNVERMFPEAGDVPGHDLVQGVRPDHAVRFMSAQAEGSHFQLAMYTSKSSPVQALDSYDARLVRQGYVALAPHVLDEAVPTPARVYSLGEHDSLVVLAQAHGDQTIISTYRLGSSGRVSLEP
jgi:hypothetical protein